MCLNIFGGQFLLLLTPGFIPLFSDMMQEAISISLNLLRCALCHVFHSTMRAIAVFLMVGMCLCAGLYILRVDNSS
jgi:hypothetical protein